MPQKSREIKAKTACPKDYMLNGSLQQLRRRGDVAMQSVVNLLTAERRIVGLLLGNYKVYTIEQAVHDRNMMVHHSSPGVRGAYDKIMNMASYEPGIEQKLQKSRPNYSSARFYRALSRADARAMLNNIQESIDNYSGKIRQMQS